ncbi:MAG: nicotinamide-nucleotide amidohydrolase family protein [Cryobacterium sp.]|nr:nicotinamide-nucleotide amidohydrolase family protein [Oligoflexia bacterium]
MAPHSRGKLAKEVETVIHLLRKKNARLVFAESCTGGLLGSLFTEHPGVSEIFTGSFVVYRESAKKSWLGVKNSTLKKFSAVSAECAEEMVRGALKKTPEATLAAAVTGYLGPDGNPAGRVWISILERSAKSAQTVLIDLTHLPTQNIRKGTRKRSGFSALENRLRRRELAALATLFLVRSSLEG